MTENKKMKQLPEEASGSARQEIAHSYRFCLECGLRLDVTYLLPGRRYCCAGCKTSFIHDRERVEEVEKPQVVAEQEVVSGESQTSDSDIQADKRGKTSILPRAGLVTIVYAGIALVLHFSHELFLKPSFFVGLVAVGGGGFALLIFLLRKVSCDATGFRALFLMGLAFLILALNFGIDQPLPPEESRSMVIITVFFLGFAGMYFVLFFRRLGLPLVGPKGKLIARAEDSEFPEKRLSS